MSRFLEIFLSHPKSTVRVCRKPPCGTARNRSPLKERAESYIRKFNTASYNIRSRAGAATELRKKKKIEIGEQPTVYGVRVDRVPNLAPHLKYQCHELFTYRRVSYRNWSGFWRAIIYITLFSSIHYHSWWWRTTWNNDKWSLHKERRTDWPRILY